MAEYIELDIDCTMNEQALPLFKYQTYSTPRRTLFAPSWRWIGMALGRRPRRRFKPSVQHINEIRLTSKLRWNLSDLLLVGLWLVSLGVLEAPSVAWRLLISCCLLAGLLLPTTSRFLQPVLPVIVWLTFWYSSQYVLTAWRPSIWARLLPAIDNILLLVFNLSQVLSLHSHPLLDIMAWIPYGILHYIAPIIEGTTLSLFASPYMASVFLRNFGFLCITGVIIQFVFPCTPPWYEAMYGSMPAEYGMPGSAGGLSRIDELLGLDMYTSSFAANPAPFGAFPSLHAGTAAFEALFLTFAFPKLKYIFVAYPFWMGWATMYLSHHYLVDILGGAALAALFFHLARKRLLIYEINN